VFRGGHPGHHGALDRGGKPGLHLVAAEQQAPDGGGLDRTADLGIMSGILDDDGEPIRHAIRRFALVPHRFNFDPVSTCFYPHHPNQPLNCHRYSH
jgi:hypothetical protein